MKRVQNQLLNILSKSNKPEDQKIAIKYIDSVAALHGEGDPNKIIENVRLLPNGEIRGDDTEQTYTMKDAVKMNDKYDELAKAGYFKRKDIKDALTTSEAIIAMSTGSDAARFHKQDPKLIKKYNDLRTRAAKILKEDKRKELQELKNKKLDKAGPFEKIIKKIQKPNKKVAYTPNKPSEANGKDEYPNVIPIGPIPHEKPWYDKPKPEDKSYQFKFPKAEDNTLAKLQLVNDLENAVERTSGIGMFDRRAYANGGNGSTKPLDDKRPFTKRVEEIYNIQLRGDETFGELLEIIRKLNEK